MTVRKYTSRSQQTTITSAITSGSSSMTVASASTLLGGIAPSSITGGVTFTVVIDPDTALEEILDITGASSSTFNITRQVDGSSAQDHSAGAVVRHMVIGRDLREPNTHAETATGVHGLASTSSVVGTLDAQTLTNKTIDMTGVTLTGLSSSGMSSSSATPKSYVDNVLVLQTAQATAAATSASSASTSASSAATSASSAATSATSAAASATTAAASVATITTSASSASTSATSAAASATAAATSAASASASATVAANSSTAATTSASSAATSATSSANFATAASTSASSAATSASSAATSATSAAASATTAAASVATITTSASSASTSASSAATSASSAATSASSAATSATSAAASTSAAATSATSAAASATAASTSATSAAASATAASTSATSAATQATAAATSATSAATQATAAATSASSAATSATSAATSASSSLTTYNTYKTYYLGSFSSAPSLDNQGNALITGATYFNSSSSLMYAWSGSVWQAISTTSSYSAPTLGSTTINSGTTYGTITGLTLASGLTTADPTTALGIANKQYVDSVTAAINFHAPVIAASVSNLSANYSNGTSGVGATLTADTNRAFSTLDGQSVSVGQRILIKDQTTQLQNGIYTLTTVGSGSVPWVITRATDNDASPELANGDIVFTTGGTVNSGKTFVNSTTGTITVGTTAITWSTYYTNLPLQTGNSGKYLTTDGTTPSWATVDLTIAANVILTLMGAY